MRAAMMLICAGLTMPAGAAERVYFTSDRSGSTQLYSMNPDGSGPRQHTTSAAIKAHAYFCAGDRRVYFQSGDALAVLDADGREQVLLSVPGVQYHSPRCSDDGKLLVATAWDRKVERPELQVYDLPGMARRLAVEGEYASWRPGRHTLIYRVVHLADDGGRIGIETRDVDARPPAARELYTADLGESLYDISEPQFFGVGDADLVFRASDEHEYYYYQGETGNSFVRSRAGERLRHHNVYHNEIDEPLEQAQLTLSPDRRLAAMTEHPWNSPPVLYLVDLRSRDSRRIADGFNPVWSPDGRRLYYNSDPAHYARYAAGNGRDRAPRTIYPEELEGYEIYVYDLDRKQSRRLTENNVYDGFL